MSSQEETPAALPDGDESGSLELHRSRHAALSENGGALSENGSGGDTATAVAVPIEDRSEDEDYAEVIRAQRRRRTRRVLILVLAVVVLAAAVVAATGLLGRRDKGTASVAPSGPPATAKVEKTTLSRTQTVDGTLGYGDVDNVQAPPGGKGGAGGGSSGAGIITWLPSEGDTIERGDPVYRVDQEKVPLLYGSIPLYRTLSDGSEGDDVKQLEKNLSALGYDGFTVDDEYTGSTADAVQEWQDDLGRDETGVVKPGDAVVASGARRVSALTSSPGALPAGVLLKWTGTTRVVDVDLDTDYADLVRIGTKATVELPDGTEVAGQVTDIGTPTSKAGSGTSGSSDDGATIPVELSIKDQKKLGNYEAAKVDVHLTAETHKNVLAVPINALVAQSDGGYAVEAVTATGTRYVPVKTGMFSDSYVQVSGAGITEGMVVGVPK
jgi:hypothetical protein